MAKHATSGVVTAFDGRPVRAALLPMLVFGLFACGDSATGPGSTAIGAEGGTASLAGDSVTLSVSAGSLSSSVEFTANRTTSVPQTTLLVPGSAYEIGPAGTTFDHLVTLTVAYDPAAIPDGVRETELALQEAVGSEWQIAVGTSVDASRHEVSGRISSVGSFGVVGLPADVVELYPTQYALGVGDTKQLLAVVRGPTGGTLPERKVRWTSSSEDVATVDSGGVVTAVRAGLTTITAAAEGRLSTTTISVYDCSAQTGIPTTECEAVIDLYDAVTQNDWRSRGSAWVRGTDPCTWAGVTCDDGSVSRLVLRNRGDGGSIPYSVGNLTALTWLDLSGNSLTGSIPLSVGSLTRLEFLSLGSNDLSGAIPPELGQLTSLKELNLYFNQLSRPIPGELGNLSSLTALRLQGNQLSGSIPPELGQLSSLRELALYDNPLSGSIPRELGGLTELRTLSLFLNGLTGSIPKELGNLANLENLSLSGNELSGSIPTEMGNLSNLQGVTLYDNKLTGALPLPVARLGGKMQFEYLRTVCVFTPGNTGLSMPDNQDFRDADLDADGLICGVPIG